MIATINIPGKLWVFLLLLCTTRLNAQEWTEQEASFPNVQHIPLVKIKGTNAVLRFNSAPLHLFVFLSPECPLCKNYSIALNSLAQNFGKNVQLVGIVPGKAYSNSEIKKYLQDYKIAFPVYIDPVKEFSNYTQATVTPEAILMDNTGKVVYRGAIDDWVQELGKKKLKPEQLYLVQAIEQFLQGNPIQVKSTSPIGCLINEF